MFFIVIYIECLQKSLYFEKIWNNLERNFGIKRKINTLECAKIQTKTSESVIYRAQTFLKNQHFFQQKLHLQYDFDGHYFSNFLEIVHFSKIALTFWSVLHMNRPKNTYPMFTEHTMNRPKSSHLHHWSTSPVFYSIAHIEHHKANSKHLKGLYIEHKHNFHGSCNNDVWSL